MRWKYHIFPLMCCLLYVGPVVGVVLVFTLRGLGAFHSLFLSDQAWPVMVWSEVGVGVGYVMMVWAVRWREKKGEREDWRARRCESCGYDCRASVGRCPECGRGV